jgi:hypothetical protein
MVKPKEKELTNEKLSSLFSDNFQLAVTAIRLAQNEVNAGREVTMQNVLAQIKLHPHLYSFEDRLTMPAFETHD